MFLSNHNTKLCIKTIIIIRAYSEPFYKYGSNEKNGYG